MSSSGQPLFITHDSKSLSIQHLCSCDEHLKKLISTIGDLSYSLSADSFSHLVNTIIGQMLSNKVADIISARFYKLCNGNISPDNLLELTVDKLRNVGLSVAKSKYILNLARHCTEYPCFLSDLSEMPDGEVVKKLTAIRGIGSWSAKMFLIFVLDRQDVLPYEDGAFQQAFRWLYPDITINKNAIIDHCSKWSPYSSIASRYLYIALDNGFTKQSISLL